MSEVQNVRAWGAALDSVQAARLQAGKEQADLAVKRQVPYVYGGAVGTRGMAMTIRPGASPCLRCVFEEPPPPGVAQTCDTAGVLGAGVATVAAMQVTEVLKLLLEETEALRGTLAEFDLWSGTRRDVRVARDAECPACAHHRFEFLEGGRGVRAVWMGKELLCVTLPPKAHS